MAKDPDSIERDIERSRAQLAESIDAIADRVSPRRVADRGTRRAKASLQSLRDRMSSLRELPAGSSGGSRPAIGTGSTTGRPGTGADRLGTLVSRGSALLSSGSSRATELVRRKDPAALTTVAATAATLLVLLLLRRRRR